MSNPVGRPSKYDPKYCHELIEHMSQGLSFEAFAGLIGTCKQTLYTWEKEHPEFVDAKRLGTSKCQLFFERLGLDGMFNEHQGKHFNTSNWIFQMKNRFKWRDAVETKTEISFSEKDAEKLSDQELLQELEATTERLKNELSFNK